MTCLPTSFYARDTFQVARDLLGHRLVRLIASGDIYTRVSGIIVETEAYGQKEDEASHAFRGRTVRNSVMFGPVGHAYVYLSYGVHFCLNVSARASESDAGAVLIRSMLPLDGISTMHDSRNGCRIQDLSSGPGKLTQAMGITLSENGVDLTRESSLLRIEQGQPATRVVATSRIGISKGRDKMWRFVDFSSPCLSRPVSRIR